MAHAARSDRAPSRQDRDRAGGIRSRTPRHAPGPRTRYRAAGRTNRTSPPTPTPDGCRTDPRSWWRDPRVPSSPAYAPVRVSGTAVSMAAAMEARVAVLASGEGTNLQALLDDPGVSGSIALVVSDRADARALERARRAGVKAEYVDPTPHPD